MKLFLPGIRTIIILLALGLCSLGAAFYLRYFVIEQSSVALACEGGLKTWPCASRRITIAMFSHSVFGGTALAVAMLNLLRPWPVFLAAALIAAAFGIVLYNVVLSALAIGLLVLSLARRAPEPE